MNPIRAGRLATGLLGLVILATPAAAQDSMFDIAFGATVTTDYMSRGTTQTDGGPAIQGYFEAAYSQLYFGGFISNVNYGQYDDTEVDLQAGWRPVVGPVTFDLGVIGYFYAIDDNTNYAELYAKAGWDANSWLNVGTKLYYAPDYVQSGTEAFYGEGNAKITLPYNFSLSGALGYQEFEAAYGPGYLTWNAGVSWTWRDVVTFDVRYWDTDLTGPQCDIISTHANSCDARVVASMSIDTSWSALRGLVTQGQ